MRNPIDLSILAFVLLAIVASPLIVAITGVFAIILAFELAAYWVRQRWYRYKLGHAAGMQLQ